MTVKLRPLRRSRTQLRCTRSGSRVLIHPGDMHQNALFDFVRWCAAEPGYTVVALCVPPEGGPEILEDVIEDLAACPGVLRLIPAQLGTDSTLEYGEWLARRLGRAVLAHQGPVTTVPGGGLYIQPTAGAGWLGFDRGGASLPHSRRFPRPSWDCAPFAEPRGFGPEAALDPLPAGVWIHPAEESADVLAFRRWLIGNVPADPLLPRVVLGYPGAPMPPISAVAEFWNSLPGALRPAVRFAGFGGSDDGMALYGQTLADALDTPVVLADGVQLAQPTPGGGFELRTVLRRGVMAWSPYVGDLGYLPVRSTGGVVGDPVIIGHRAPIAGLQEREPGVYRYSHDAVLEVTQSGLWMRPHALPSDSFMVRAEQADPTFTMVVFDASTPASAHRMQLLATEMVERLEPGVRSVARILPSTATGTARRARLARSAVVLDTPRESAIAASPFDDAPTVPEVVSSAPALNLAPLVEEPAKALASAVIPGVDPVDAASGMITLHVPIATLLAGLQDGSEPEPGSWRPRLGGSPPAPPAASAPAEQEPETWTGGYDEAPVPPAVALYALSWPASDTEGAESEPDLVSRTVAEVRRAPAAARPVIGGEPTGTFPALTDELPAAADAIVAARSGSVADQTVSAGAASTDATVEPDPELRVGSEPEAVEAEQWHRRRRPKPRQSQRSEEAPKPQVEPELKADPELRVGSEPEAVEAEQWHRRRRPRPQQSRRSQESNEPARSAVGSPAVSASQGADVPGEPTLSAAGTPPAPTPQRADVTDEPAPSVAETRPAPTPQPAQEPDEPIQYGSFQLVSSGTDPSFGGSQAPARPALARPRPAASTAASAPAQPSSPTPAPPAAAPSAPAVRQVPAASAPPRPAQAPRPAAAPEPAQARSSGQAPQPAPPPAPARTAPDARTPVAPAEPVRPVPAAVPPAAAAQPTADESAKRRPERRPAKSSVRVQPVPTAQCSVLPREGGIEKERDWMRRNLSKQYDATASSVARLLSEYPGLRAGSSASDIGVLTDLVALRLYLTGKIGGLDEAVRAAKVGPHVPLARCVASGLRRLPSYRGPLRTRASLTEEQVRWYGARGLVTEWSFLPALATGAIGLPGDAEILIWSMSARRTGLFDPSLPDQAVFQPGTSFKVLSAESGSEGPRIQLRELTRTEVAPDGTVQSMKAMDEFAVSVLNEAGRAWRQEDPVERLPADRQDWFASPPGLLGSVRVDAAGPAKKGVKA